MANKYLEIVTDIKTKMETVTNVGIVHPYYRWNKSSKEFIKLFAYTPINQPRQIRGWEITRLSAAEHKAGVFFRHHKFRLSGYMSLQDKSETDIEFQELIEEVCNVFRNVEDQGGATWYYMDGDDNKRSSPQVPGIRPKMFGSVLCHTTEIILTITERIIALRR